MKKATIELVRFPGHTPGYGLMREPYNQESKSTYERLLEWAQDNSSAKVYRHYLWFAEEDKKKEDEKWICDAVYYLDIYYQEK